MRCHATISQSSISAVALAFASMAAAACTSSPTSVASDAEALAVTDRAEYSAPSSTEDRLTIRFVYSNRTRDTIWFVQCGPPRPILEKLVNGEWLRAAGGSHLDCLNAHSLERGSQLREELVVRASSFVVDSVPGTYRLAWQYVVWNYNAGSPPFGSLLPEAYRVSNRFVIVP